MNINDFKAGSVITRTELVKYSGVEDGSYIGECFTLMGVTNGTIYLKDEKEDKVKKLAAALFADGWQYYDNRFEYRTFKVSIPTLEIVESPIQATSFREAAEIARDIYFPLISFLSEKTIDEIYIIGDGEICTFAVSQDPKPKVTEMV